MDKLHDKSLRGYKRFKREDGDIIRAALPSPPKAVPEPDKPKRKSGRKR